MAEGRVKWCDELKGYGSIQQDDGNNLLVLHQDVEGTRLERSLKEGDRKKLSPLLDSRPRSGGYNGIRLDEGLIEAGLWSRHL